MLLTSLTSWARFGLEYSNPPTRFEFNQGGTSRSFISSSSTEYKLFYQYEASGPWTWGASYFSHSTEISKSDSSYSFESTSFNATKISLYVARGSKSGFFTQVGIDKTTTPYFYFEGSEIKSEDVERLDIFLKLGVYYKYAWGGGEISYKYTLLPSASVDGHDLSGTGTEVYFNIFFNKGQNFGLYFNYTNEFVDGDYEHVADSRSLGLILRY